jgi:hypothetical protein
VRGSALPQPEKETPAESSPRAIRNPGALRIEDLCGNVIWPEGARQ